MTRGARILVRLVTLVLALSVVGFILTASFVYMWRNAEANSPKVALAFEPGGIDETIDKTVARVQLRMTGVDVSMPVAPDDDAEVIFVVEEGQSTTAVAYHLERVNLITSADAFRYFIQAEGSDRSVQAGVFPLKRSMTMAQILHALQTGGADDVQVTIPEGWRAEQVAALLVENGVIESAEDFLQAVQMGRSDYPFLTDRPEGASDSVEGFLFPDTYRFPRYTQPQVVLDIMLDNWQVRVDEDLQALADASGLTMYELVTLASLVEREAVLADERALIARVYLNRIGIDMPLQADPTVQFAKANAAWNPEAPDASIEAMWPTLTRGELNAIESPYNTYLNQGLPPGPICSPGLASIEAALAPAPEGSPYADALYFVAVADDRVPAVPPERAAHLEAPTPGMHLFTVSYDEHLQNDQAYGER
ncbi:MAG: endolytic transglycosylase MltG [Chloroflexi bacterium]|nr:endolytic transglycosylase MltG [Chloroflexota bacterium]